MNAPAKKTGPVADAWAIIGFALGKFSDENGREVFSEWLQSLPNINLTALRQVCEELNARRESNSYVTITLATVKGEYLARIGATPTVSPKIPACSICCNTGVVGVLVAGDSIGDARIIPRNQVAPWAYAVASTLPCRDCPRGTSRGKGKAAGTASETRLRYLWDQCVFATLHAADDAARACVRLRHKQEEQATAAALKPSPRRLLPA